jgi:cellulose synthase/poly-beta-1,6-N-acetylglucosamine synthase-like glycosyltransferase
MMKETGYVLYGIYVLMTVWLLLNGMVQLHLLRKARKKKNDKRPHWTGPLPFITIQVPVYNEKYVVEGLLDSLAKLDYPRHLFEILVLDDSTDETSDLLAGKAAALQRQGFQVSIIPLTNRK